MTADSTTPHVLVAEHVLTMGSGQVEVKAVVIQDGRIRAVGGRDLVRTMESEDARVTDFGDRAILPGFVDSHVHYEVESVALGTSVPIQTPPCDSIDDIVQTLRENIDRAELRGGWLVGEGNLMQDQRLRDRRVPNRDDLDRVSTSVPIALRIGGHTTAMNTAALKRLDLSEQSRLPRGAVLERDSQGRLTGVAREIFYHLPIPLPDKSEMPRILLDGMKKAFTQYGVTAIGEIPRTGASVQLMEQLLDAGRMHCRIRAFLRPGPTAPIEDVIAIAHDFQARARDDGLFRVQGIKLFSDGGLSAAVAATLRNYAVRPGSRGRLQYTGPRLRAMIGQIVAAGLQPMIHAVGERAQLAACEAFKGSGASEVFEPKLRPRLEHAGNFVSDPRVPIAWREANALPVPNIVMLYSFGSYMPLYLGAYAVKGRFPLRTLADEGWRLASGSDVTGDEPQATNPLFGIWTAVARQTVTGEVVEPEEALEIDEALRMYTIDAAAALGDEHEIGSLEPGKQADIVVLSRDPRTTPADELRTIQVDEVFLKGMSIHRREQRATQAVRITTSASG